MSIGRGKYELYLVEGRSVRINGGIVKVCEDEYSSVDEAKRGFKQAIIEDIAKHEIVNKGIRAREFEVSIGMASGTDAYNRMEANIIHKRTGRLMLRQVYKVSNGYQ